MAKKAKVWDGSTWQDLVNATQDLTPYSTTAQMNTAIAASAGLTLITSATIGSAVSNVTVTNCFSSAYQNYRIVLSGGVGSTATTLRCQLNGVTTGWYSGQIYQIFGGSTGGAQVSNNTNAYFGFATATSLSGVIDVCNPNQALPKYITGLAVEMATNGSISVVGGYNASTAQATDFIFFPNSGTLTGGTIKVYGYKNS